MSDDALTAALTATEDGVLLRVKVVPGASRSRVAGLHGDRLKVQVAAPAEGGKANRAVCALLADLFSVPVRKIRVSAGTSSPLKLIAVEGVSPGEAVRLLRARVA